VPNSVSILHDLLPISIDMTKKERKGVYNFTNPGAASHNEVLALYKKVHLPTPALSTYTQRVAPR
jgi:hypothetical protein